MPMVQVNGAMLHYHETGSGTPVIFIHPPLINSKIFRYQREQLSDRFRIITFDIRGHGYSPPASAPISYALIAEDIRQLMDRLHIDKAYLCGYSTGGSIVLEAMLTCPERVAGGILVSGMSESSGWRLQSEIKLAVYACRIGAGKMLARGICRGNADSTTTYRALLRDALQGHVGHWRRYFEESLIYNCSGRLNEISQPVLAICGSKDKNFVKYAGLMRRRLKNSEMFRIRGATHQLPTKKALQLNELIRGWLIRQTEPGGERKRGTPHDFPNDIEQAEIEHPL